MAMADTPNVCTKIIEQCDAAFALLTNGTVLDAIALTISAGIVQETTKLADEFQTSGIELRTALQLQTSLIVASLGLLGINLFVLVLAWAYYTQRKGARLRALDMSVFAA